MAEQDKINLFKELRSKKGFDLIILTTYTFDPIFFDHYLEKVLRKNNPHADIIVLIDLKEYISSSKNFTSETNRDYQLILVPVKKVFHPKIFLFHNKKDPNKSELIVGSSNLTIPGITKNLEIISKIKNSPEYIVSAFKFFKGLIEKKLIINKSFINIINSIEIKGISHISRDNLLFNLEKDILSQLISQINTEVEEITIAAPFFSPNNSLLKLIQEKISPKKIRVAVQKGNNYLKRRTISDISNLDLLSINLEEPRKLHFKMLYIKTKDKNYFLIGSANFTESALSQTVDKGNCEVSILLSGKNYDDFISILNFKAMKEEDIEDREIDYSGEQVLPKIIILDSDVDKLQEVLNIHINKRFKEETALIYINNGEEKLESHAKEDKIVVDIADRVIYDVCVEIQKIKSNTYRLHIPRQRREGIYSKKIKENPKDVFKALLNRGDFSEIIAFISDLEGIEYKPIKSGYSKKETGKKENITMGKKPGIKEEQSFIEYLISLVPSKPSEKKVGPKSPASPKERSKRKKIIKDNLNIFINKLNGRLMYLFKQNKYEDKDEVFISFQGMLITSTITLLIKLDLDNPTPFFYQILNIVKENMHQLKLKKLKDKGIFEDFLSLLILIKFLIKRKEGKVVSSGIVSLLSRLGEIDISVDGINKLSMKVIEISKKFNISLELDEIKDFLIKEIAGTFFNISKNKEGIIDDLISNFNKSDSVCLYTEKMLNAIIPHSSKDILVKIKSSLEDIESTQSLDKFQFNALNDIKLLLKKYIYRTPN